MCFCILHCLLLGLALLFPRYGCAIAGCTQASHWTGIYNDIDSHVLRTIFISVNIYYQLYIDYRVCAEHAWRIQYLGLNKVRYIEQNWIITCRL